MTRPKAHSDEMKCREAGSSDQVGTLRAGKASMKKELKQNTADVAPNHVCTGNDKSTEGAQQNEVTHA